MGIRRAAMSERHGDWAIKKSTEGRDAKYVVTGWGLRWWCKTLEDARAVAELLDRVTSVALDVSVS